MAAHNQTHNQVLHPHTLAELFSFWNRIPDAAPFAGGTELILKGIDPGGARGVFREQPELLREILSLEQIDELQAITRTERYLEIGAMVRLNDIIALGKIVPQAFFKTLKGIANPRVRNLATIGGNICSSGDTLAPLCALDAVYELRSAAGSRWIPALRFSSTPGVLQKGELLARIRIPLDEWNYTVYRKFNAFDSEGEGGVLILVVRNQKNILAKIQMIFTGAALLRNKDSESFLEGKALPLDARDIVHYRKFWGNYLESEKKPGPILRDKIINAIEIGIAGLSD